MVGPCLAKAASVNFSYAEIDLLNQRVDLGTGEDESAVGYGIDISYLLSDYLFLFGTFHDVQGQVGNSEFGLRSQAIGLGVAVDVTSWADLFVKLAPVIQYQVSCDFPVTCISEDDGWGATSGMAVKVGTQVELLAGYSHIDNTDTSNTYTSSFSVHYRFDRYSGVVIGFETDNRSDNQARIGYRYSFP